REQGRRIRELFADLDHDRYAVREAACRELKRLGIDALQAVRAALSGPLSAEARRRLEGVLDVIGADEWGALPSPADRRPGPRADGAGVWGGGRGGGGRDGRGPGAARTDRRGGPRGGPDA